MLSFISGALGIVVKLLDVVKYQLLRCLLDTRLVNVYKMLVRTTQEPR